MAGVCRTHRTRQTNESCLTCKIDLQVPEDLKVAELKGHLPEDFPEIIISERSFYRPAHDDEILAVYGIFWRDFEKNKDDLIGAYMLDRFDNPTTNEYPRFEHWLYQLYFNVLRDGRLNLPENLVWVQKKEWLLHTLIGIVAAKAQTIIDQQALTSLD
jgi:hypothetical protein